MNLKELKEVIRKILPNITEKELHDLITAFFRYEEDTWEWITSNKHNISGDMDSCNTYIITDKEIKEFLKEKDSE